MKGYEIELEYKLQNGKYFEEFEPLEDRGDGYINSLGHFLRKRTF